VEAAFAWLCPHGLDRMRTDAERAVRATVRCDPWHSTALVALGVAELLAGNLLRADRVFQRAAASAEASGAPDMLATALTERALASLEVGDWAAAEGLVRDALDIVRTADLADCATSLLTFVAKAHVAARAGDVLSAERELQRARPYLDRSKALPWLSGQVRLELGRVDVMLGDYVKAAARVAEVQDVLRRGPELGTLTLACAAVDEDVRAAREPIDGWPASLTAAERRLLPLLATHRTFREIAGDLGISRNTVKTQAISVYRKLQVTSRTEAVHAAVELGLLADPNPSPLAAAV
jgi:LuxR family maltose regulon positive regulatory protein